MTTENNIIVQALLDLDEPNGSSRAAISNHIKLNYNKDFEMKDEMLENSDFFIRPKGLAGPIVLNKMFLINERFKERNVEIFVEDYSTRSFVIRSNPDDFFKAYRTQLKDEFLGKYNTFLKGGPGWIVSINKKWDFFSFLEKILDEQIQTSEPINVGGIRPTKERHKNGIQVVKQEVWLPKVGDSVVVHRSAKPVLNCNVSTIITSGKNVYQMTMTLSDGTVLSASLSQGRWQLDDDPLTFCMKKE